MKRISALLFYALSALPICAQSKPNAIDFTRILHGFDGKELTVPDEQKKPVPMTLSDVSVTALETVIDEDRNASGATKFKHDLLARRIYRNKSVVAESRGNCHY